MTEKWWHDKIAYQIYPKSFLDSNGDGIGDLRGIISKLDYIKALGIDIIWLSPIYKSPFVDQGYDISDYYAIAEEFGTMEEFDELLAEAKKRNMHIIMDLVINHCSDKHEWFQKALADPDGEYADYFYFRKGKNGNPPSNYRSYFGGSCWEPVPGTDKYYFHMFAKEQTGGLKKALPVSVSMRSSTSKKTLLFLTMNRTDRMAWPPAGKWSKTLTV